MTELEPALSPGLASPSETEDTVRQMVAAWILAQDSEHTKIAYARDLMSTAPRMRVPGWLPWCAERTLDPLTVRRAHVDAYKHALQQANYSPASISRRLAVVSSWYQYLTDEEVIETNPAKAVKRPKVDQSVSHAVGLSEKELDQLLWGIAIRRPPAGTTGRETVATSALGSSWQRGGERPWPSETLSLSPRKRARRDQPPQS